MKLSVSFHPTDFALPPSLKLTMQKTRSTAASTKDDAPSKDKEIHTEVSNPPPKPQGSNQGARPTKGKQGQSIFEIDTGAQATQPTKRMKASDANLALPTPPGPVIQPKTNRGKATSEPHGSLPVRKGRNNHPGLVAQPRPWHTSAQVAEERAAQKDRKKWLAELEEEKKQLYAQMEIDKDERVLEHKVNAICWLSDIVQPRATEENVVSSKDKSEKFNMDVNSDTSEESKDSDREHHEKKAKVNPMHWIHIFRLNNLLTLERAAERYQSKGFANRSCCR